MAITHKNMSLGIGGTVTHWDSMRIDEPEPCVTAEQCPNGIRLISKGEAPDDDVPTFRATDREAIEWLTQQKKGCEIVTLKGSFVPANRAAAEMVRLIMPEARWELSISWGSIEFRHKSEPLPESHNGSPCIESGSCCPGCGSSMTETTGPWMYAGDGWQGFSHAYCHTCKQGYAAYMRRAK